MKENGSGPNDADTKGDLAFPGKDTTVLLVEDEGPVLRLLTFLLERQGYKLITVTDGDDVLPLMYQHRPRLVVLDIMLPNRDGIELLQAIRNDVLLCKTPVIVLSAKAQDVDITQGLSVGANLYITKPFHPEMLTQSIGGFIPRVRVVLSG